MAPPADPAALSATAADLIAFVRGLTRSAGIERSCKLSEGRIDARRFLLSLGADRRTAAAAIGFVERHGMPEGARAEFAAHAMAAAFLHLGYEEGEGGARLKAYCERDLAGSEATPLYSAWKWTPGEPMVEVDDYRLIDDAQGYLIVDTLTGEQGIADACCDLFARCQREGGEPMLLDVRRRGAARRSFDLRLYGGQWPVAAAGRLLARAGAAFALPDAAERVTELAEGRLLGHVSGGRDDRNRTFVTLYFGAAELA